MVDFRLSPNDLGILEQVRQEGLAARSYARHYDEHEEEVSTAKLPEADEFPALVERIRQRPSADTPPATFQMLMSIARSWGDTVMLSRPTTALGNAAPCWLRHACAEERWVRPRSRWPSPSRAADRLKAIRPHVRHGGRWVLSGEKIFVTSGIRAQAVVWATVTRSTPHQVVE
jgi:acyl-CoA dehydrogenase